MSALIFLIGLAAWCGTSQQAFASSITPPVYAHSWYINDPSYSGMSSLGAKEGQWTSSNCSRGPGFDEMVLLDFGAVGHDSGNGVYGTYDFASKYPFISDFQIINAVEFYMQSWYLFAGPCPHLHLVIGTSNYQECPTGSPCDVYTAGQQWANVVDTVNRWLIRQNYGRQMIAYGGDDIETGWDSFSKTRPFVDGFNANDPAYYKLMDFGDAWQHTGWTDADVYYVAQGAANDSPLPEIYSPAAATRWAQIEVGQGPMQFSALITECQGSDPLPVSDCQVGNHTELAPNQAWRQLRNTLNSNGVGQASLDYTTNIKYQGQ